MAMTLTRAKLEELVGGLLERTKQPCKNCLKDAGVSTGEISEVLLVGGMSRMPKVQEYRQGSLRPRPEQGGEPG